MVRHGEQGSYRSLRRRAAHIKCGACGELLAVEGNAIFCDNPDCAMSTQPPKKRSRRHDED